MGFFGENESNSDLNLSFNPLTLTVSCHTSTAIKHPVSDRAKPSFVIFDIWAL